MPIILRIVFAGFSTGLCLVTANPAAAGSQVPDAVLEHARLQELNGRRPIVFFAVEQGGAWELTSVYFQPMDGAAVSWEGPRYWVARRTSGRESVMSDQVRWTTNRDCPQMEGALWWLNALEAPSISVPGMASPRPELGGPDTAMAVHAPLYTIWGSAMTPDHPSTEMRLSARWGRIAEWGEATEANLASCWSDEPPE